MDYSVIIQALLLCKGVSRKIINKLHSDIKSCVNESEVLGVITHLNNNRIDEITIAEFRKKISISENLKENSLKQNISILNITDEQFPSRLRKINDPPVLLYLKGDISKFENCINVALIGTREPSQYGARIAERLGIQFTERGCNIISGLAIGCDSFAHIGCLKAKGLALAVMPGGLDRIYPSSNRSLAETILNTGGALISEYPPGVKPFPSFYVDRDRLQSAISDAIVVVETGIQGGTMHTVNFALQQGKTLAAYRHPEKYSHYDKCKGNLLLINTKKALPIDNESEIIDLIEKVKNTTNSTVEVHTNKDIETQLSFLN